MFIAYINGGSTSDDFSPFLRLKSETRDDALLELEFIVFNYSLYTDVYSIYLFEVSSEIPVKLFDSYLEKRKIHKQESDTSFKIKHTQSILENYHRIKELISSGKVSGYGPSQSNEYQKIERGDGYFANPGYYESPEGIERQLPKNEMARMLYKEYVKTMTAIDAAIMVTEILLKQMEND